MVWLKVLGVGVCHGSKAAVIRGLQNDAIYLKSSSIRQLHFLGLICQLEAAATLSAFERERVL